MGVVKCLLNKIDCVDRATFELEPGAVGQTADFKEVSKKLEWSLKKVPYCQCLEGI